jgi:hypothetical protein
LIPLVLSSRRRFRIEVSKALRTALLFTLNSRRNGGTPFHPIGFHLRGSLAFLDFEYFGRDDSVKFTAEILMHRGPPLQPPHRRRFHRAATHLRGADLVFVTRLSAYLPLFVLRWLLILFNEFILERWQGRALAGEIGAWNDVKAWQLTHAPVFLASFAEKLEA